MARSGGLVRSLVAALEGMWAIRFALMLLLITYLRPGSAQAYGFLGGRWANQPTSGCCLTLTYNSSLTTNTYDQTGWNDALGSWNSSGANVIYISANSSYLVDLRDTYDSTVGWDGYTRLYVNGVECYGTSCRWNYDISFLNDYYTHDYSRQEIHSVAAHELGHTAGLAHQAKCVLMDPYTFGSYPGRYTSTCGYIYTPQSDDINGVNAQY